MIKITPHKIAILMGILLSPSVFATDINVEFTATVKATTCNITLTGNNVTNDGNNNYTLRIPKMVWIRSRIKRQNLRLILNWLLVGAAVASVGLIPL
ncbi:hypothetical protein OkiPb00196_07440 [Escherichia coli]